MFLFTVTPQINQPPLRPNAAMHLCVSYGEEAIEEPRATTATDLVNISPIPESFMRALEDIKTGRIMGMEQALGDVPPAD